jgi:hypothetical protein
MMLFAGDIRSRRKEPLVAAGNSGSEWCEHSSHCCHSNRPTAYYPFEAGGRLNNIYEFSRTAKKTQHFTVTNINWLTLFKEIIAVYSKNHTKQINALSGQNAELVIIKASGKESNHWALKGYYAMQSLENEKQKVH